MFWFLAVEQQQVWTEQLSEHFDCHHKYDDFSLPFTDKTAQKPYKLRNPLAKPIVRNFFWCFLKPEYWI